VAKGNTSENGRSQLAYETMRQPKAGGGYQLAAAARLAVNVSVSMAGAYRRQSVINGVTCNL
jgi:hypothetical protein